MASRTSSSYIGVRRRSAGSGPRHTMPEQCSDTENAHTGILIGRSLSSSSGVLATLPQHIESESGRSDLLPVEETENEARFPYAAQLASKAVQEGKDSATDDSLSGYAPSTRTPTGDREQPQAVEPASADQAERILDIRKMRPYIYVGKIKRYRGCVSVLLNFLIVVQLFLVMEDSYISYGAESKHSGCVCTFPFTWILVFAIRFYSRFVIPVAVSVVFWRQIIKRPPARKGGDGKLENTAAQAFCAALEKENKAKIVRSFIEMHWDPCDMNKSQTEQLKLIHDHFEKKLSLMLLLAMVNPVILGLALWFFNVFELSNQPRFSASVVLGISDVVSLGLVSMASGIMLSFYFIEVDMKKYVRCFKATPGFTRSLIEKAKKVENCITDRWYPLEIGMRFSSVVYSFLLAISWASNTPLSCGFSVSLEGLKETKYAPACWLAFILALGIGQLLTSSPLHPDVFGPAGLCSQVLVLGFMYGFAPTYEWSALTHILYAVVPMCYLIWYNVVSITRQWVAINNSKVNDNQTHVSRLASRTGFLFLIVASLLASLSTEYKHLFPKKHL